VLAATAHELERRLADLHTRQTTLAQSAQSLTGDTLHAALIESNRIAAETQVVLLDLNRTREHEKAAEQRLDDSLHTEVALPDNLTDAEHARLLATALQTASEPEAKSRTLAAELHVSDLAELFGTSAQTINGWTRNGFPRGRATAWDPAAWIIDGPRNKRLPLDALDQTLLTSVQKERLTSFATAVQSATTPTSPRCSAHKQDEDVLNGTRAQGRAERESLSGYLCRVRVHRRREGGRVGGATGTMLPTRMSSPLWLSFALIVDFARRDTGHSARRCRLRTCAADEAFDVAGGQDRDRPRRS
jgi:hypothetical protein